MARLLVIVPSRGRPASAARLVQAFEATHAYDADLLFCVDDDDVHGPQYLFSGASVTIGPRLRLGPTLNAAAVAHAENYDVIGFMGDDHLPRTDRWDAAVLNVADEMKTAVIYGDDLLQGAALPTAVFMTSNIVRALGYFSPPELIHMYLDNSWKSWGERANCLRYLPDVTIEHLHPVNGKAQNDSSYSESSALMEPDRLAYGQYVQDRMDEDVAKIAALRG